MPAPPERPPVPAPRQRPQVSAPPERTQVPAPPERQSKSAPTSPNEFIWGVEWPRPRRRTRHDRPSPLTCHGLLSSRIHHGHLNPLTRYGHPSPLARHARPSPRIHHGRPGGLPSLNSVTWGLQSAQPPFAFGWCMARDVPFGGGLNVNFVSPFCSISIISPSRVWFWFQVCFISPSLVLCICSVFCPSFPDRC